MKTVSPSAAGDPPQDEVTGRTGDAAHRERAAFEQSFRADLDDAYGALPGVAMWVDCAEVPCIAAVTAPEGIGSAHEAYLDRVGADRTCGEIRGVQWAAAVVVECDGDGWERDAVRTATRVRALAQRFTAAIYPHDLPVGASCTLDADCDSSMCLPAAWLHACEGRRCCAAPCRRDAPACAFAAEGVDCMSRTVLAELHDAAGSSQRGHDSPPPPPGFEVPSTLRQDFDALGVCARRPRR